MSQNVHAARQNIARTVDTEMVKSHWMTGKDIVEEELQGKKRAAYGTQLLKMMAERLTRKLGRGYTETNLRYMKQFYIIYPRFRTFILNKYLLSLQSWSKH